MSLTAITVNMLQEKGFDFDDSVHRDEALARMNTMRKEGQFCDALLEVDDKPIYVHQVVLASSNVFFFEMFSRSEERNGRKEDRRIFKLDEYNLDYLGVHLLVNYFYSARIQCNLTQVLSVYKAAIKLKVARVAEQCSNYLIQCLTPQNCLGTYKVAALLDDKDCMKKVAGYIGEHVQEVLELSSELSHLPNVLVDIVGSVSPDFHLTEQPLCKLVVSWLHEEVANSSLDKHSQRSHSLVLTPDNKLVHRNNEPPDSPFGSDSEKSRDRKIRSDANQGWTRSVEKRGKSIGGQGNKSPLPHLSDSEEECRCRLIASTAVADKSFMCMAALGRSLVNVSVKFHSEDDGCKADMYDSASVDSDSALTSDKRHSQCLMTQLSPMSTARCGFGLAAVHGNIIVIGGYGRGECLNSVESYSLLTNNWDSLKSMQKARGRFSAGVVDGKLVVCGGSDGSVELNSVEAYDPQEDGWTMLPDMSSRKSSAGVAVCSGKLYVIGGLSGSKTLSYCEVFDPSLNKWQEICPLNTGRSQAGVCSYNDGAAVVAIGGCNAWNCMNSCEVYDAVNDSWSDLPPLAIARRGAGAVQFKGMLYVVGGSDAQASLTSVEIYDPQVGNWFFGPSLSVPRANMGVAVLADNRIFVIGGYSGKSFLKSLEYLAQDAEEWCSFLPADVDVATILKAKSPRARRRLKNGPKEGGSSGTGSAASHKEDNGYAMHCTNGIAHGYSDSELSSTCSVDELHKDAVGGSAYGI